MMGKEQELWEKNPSHTVKISCLGKLQANVSFTWSYSDNHYGEAKTFFVNPASTLEYIQGQMWDKHHGGELNGIWVEEAFVEM